MLGPVDILGVAFVLEGDESEATEGVGLRVDYDLGLDDDAHLAEILIEVLFSRLSG